MGHPWPRGNPSVCLHVTIVALGVLLPWFLGGYEQSIRRSLCFAGRATQTHWEFVWFCALMRSRVHHAKSTWYAIIVAQVLAIMLAQNEEHPKGNKTSVITLQTVVEACPDAFAFLTTLGRSGTQRPCETWTVQQLGCTTMMSTEFVL